jgi:hypothetical protein
MKQNKTQKTNKSVSLFLSDIEEKQKYNDCKSLLTLMSEITTCEPKMWGTSIIGFGEYDYRYKSGRTGNWFLTGFSPRKKELTLYLMCDLAHDGLDFIDLGKHRLGKGCLYIKKLSDINLQVLKKIIEDSIRIIKEKYA